MEKQTKQAPRVMIRNLGLGTHIFGAAFVHPLKDGKQDSNQQPYCASPLMQLGPKGTPTDRIEMSLEQFRYYDDEALKSKVDSREYAIYLDGRDARPDLARKDAQAARAPTDATESDASLESSVLADILAEGDVKAE